MPGRTELVVQPVLGRGCDNLLSACHGRERRRAGRPDRYVYFADPTNA